MHVCEGERVRVCACVSEGKKAEESKNVRQEMSLKPRKDKQQLVLFLFMFFLRDLGRK